MNKFGLIFFFSIIIFSINLLSCSDWSRDMSYNVKIETVEDSLAAEGIITICNYPKNISAISFLLNGRYIAGTREGSFYISKDYGNTWTKTFDMSDDGKINFISISSLTKSESIVIAGTEKGGYFSSNGGETWVEALPAKNELGNYRVLTSGYIFDKNFGFYGSDGTYNHFVFDISSLVCTYSSIQIPLTQGLPVANIITNNTSYSLSAYNSKTASAIICKTNNSLKYFSETMEISFLAVFGSSPKFLAGTNKGILISSDLGKSWNDTIMAGHKINCALGYNSGKIFFIGSSDGLFASFDYGINWKKISFSGNVVGVTSIFVNDDYVYFVTESGDIFYFIISSDIASIVYIPIPYKPFNNSTLSELPVLQWGKTNDKNKTEYRLQISNDIAFTSNVVDTATKDLCYKPTFNKSSKKYYWHVRSQNIFYESSWSETLNFIY